MIYEHFTPEVGQRVRIRLSPECDVEMWGRGFKGHPRTLDGIEGTVTPHDATPGNAPWIVKHPYCVVFDAPILVTILPGTIPQPATCNYFCAVELEPAADERGSGEG